MRLFPNVKRTKANLLKEFKGQRILDVGCGRSKTPNAIGIDRRIREDHIKEQQLDINHDLNCYPWPINSNSFDLVICQHVIEHLPNTVKTMEEFNRIVRPGGKVFIETPHFSWFEAFRHYEHCHLFTLGSFDYFLKGNGHYKTAFVPVEKKIFFDDLSYLMGIGFLANAFPRQYEKRFAFIFPATSFAVTFKVDKST